MISKRRLALLYHTIIKEHSQEPLNYGGLENKPNEFQLYNPACGDFISIQYILDDNVISDIKFEGQGCAICIASASIMTDLIKNKTIENATELIQLFLELVKGEQDLDTAPLKDAIYLQGVSQFPMRIRCATLPWHALQEGLDEKRSLEL